MGYDSLSTKINGDMFAASDYNGLLNRDDYLKNPPVSVGLLSADVTTTSTTYSDIHSDLSKTITLEGSAGVLIAVFSGSVKKDSGVQALKITFNIDGTDYDTSVEVACGDEVRRNGLSAAIAVNGLAAGAHTVKARFKVDGGTGRIYAGSSLMVIGW